jgi:hypothetical protein
MSLRRLLAGTGLALGAVLASAPAAVAGSPAGGWTSPDPSSSVSGVPLGVLEADGPLRGVADFDAGVASVAFSLTQDADDPGNGCSAVSTAPPQVANYDSTHVAFAFDASFPCNQRYQVTATVTPKQRAFRQDTPSRLPLWIDVAIPPPATTGLSAAEIASRRVVALRWDDAVHAPDFLGFDVRRSVDGGKFQTIGSTDASATSFADDDLPSSATELDYRVVGKRSGPRPGSTVSGPNGETASVRLSRTSSADGSGEGGADGSSSGSDTGTTGASGGRSSVPRRTDVPTGGGGGARSFQVPGPTTPTTADTGFQETLPFQREGATPPGDSSAVARLPDEDDDTTRQTALLLAGGGVAFSWAMALRFLSRRFAGL